MRDKIIAIAKSYKGTPYHHQGRVKGAGIDCCGLIIGVARELGLSDYDIDGYSRFADGVSLLREFADNCPQIEIDEIKPGNILIFRIRNDPQHCGILSRLNGKESLIHAYSSIGVCVEHTLDKFWRERIVAAFEFPKENHEL
jgi:NlpC/P60 family putative phage cell wall peptidase